MDEELALLELLAIPPSMEEELAMEKRILEIKECEDLNELKVLAAAISRQNYHQSHFIANCLNQMAGLQSKLYRLENTPKKKSFLKRIFS